MISNLCCFSNLLHARVVHSDVCVYVEKSVYISGEACIFLSIDAWRIA